jgi:hypothetical protein
LGCDVDELVDILGGLLDYLGIGYKITIIWALCRRREDSGNLHHKKRLSALKGGALS